ncbi:zinc metallopeptidase [Enterococcus faecalis]|uniref:Zinc metallopeptidase n=1 Tax=Enterococcus faecalis TaxID=1351 RepID=A0A974NYQ0_ENTFL|nr:zinc metallopeptidase [Enterococcus faecalis]
MEFLAFSLALIFQLVTLPVEFNASRRALSILSEGGLLTEEEVPMARKSSFCDCTYLRSSGAFDLFYNFLRLVILFGGNNRRD